MESRIKQALRGRYSIGKEVFGAVLIALILIGGAWAYVRGQEIERQWAELEAKQCLLPDNTVYLGSGVAEDDVRVSGGIDIRR